MSIYRIRLKLRAAYAKTDLRFLLMFLGVLIVPFVIFVNSGADSSGQNHANLFWQFLALGILLLAALSLGLLMFKRKPGSLSVVSRPVTLPAADETSSLL